MSHRICIMGCPFENGQSLHDFPQDPRRRAEWCRILGVYPRTKKVKICHAHFSECYIFGNRLSKYAVPNPPDARKSDIQSVTTSVLYKAADYQINGKTNFTTDSETVENTNRFKYDGNSDTESVKTEELLKDPLYIGEEPHLASNETTEPKETIGKVEEFEIRKGSTNDMIIKGRYVQTNDYLVVSYTPPRKWSLQEQVKILDEQCEQQLRKIRQLNKENYRLSLELKNYEKLLPKFRFLQKHNRFLLVQLKIHKLKLKELRKKYVKKKRLNNLDTISVEPNDFETYL